MLPAGSPFIMASGESPSPGVFGIAKLKGREDYQQWEFAMTNYFRRQGLLKAVQGTDVDTEQDKGSARRVERALGDICLMVDPQNYQYVEGCTTAQEAWKALNDKFKSKGHWRYVLLIRQLSQARFEDFDGMESYIAHITSIGQELKTMKEEVKDKYLVAMIFQGLPNEYDSIVMTICAGNGEMQLDDVILKLLDDSQRRAVSEQANEKSALNVKKKWVPKNKEHSSDSSYSSGSSSFTCWKCHEKGHGARECPNKKKEAKKEPEQQPENKKKEEKKVKTDKNNNKGSGPKKTFLCALSATYSASKPIIVDSGAEGHMSPDLRLLDNYRSSQHEQSVIVGDNGKLKVTGTGDLKLSSSGSVDKISDVLHVPGLSAILLSVSQCTDRDINVLFSKTGCKFLDAEDCEVKGTVLATGSRVNGLYQLDAEPAAKSAMIVENHKNYDMWHQRLGHVGSQKLKYLCEHSDDVNFSAVNSDMCVACALGKQCRQSFPRSMSPRVSEILDLVHTDLCGPLPESYGGSKYVLVLIDDYSRFVTVYFLSKKSEAKDKIVEYVTLWENQKGKVVKVIRSDNGGEFVNHQLTKFYKSKGIIQQRTVRYTPEQNGVAERQMRSMIESARSMILHANCSKKLWAEAVNTAVYVQNKVPHAGCANVPEKLFHDGDVKYAHLKVFGSDAYVHVPKQVRGNKLEPRARLMVFVGYDTAVKGYRLIDPKRPKDVVIEHSVKFNEGKFTACSELGVSDVSDVVYVPILDLIDDVPDIVDVPVEEEFYDADDHEEDERENDREDENANDNHEEADNNQLRRSTRERHRPQRFDEFELYAANLYNEAVFDDHVEPSTVKEALNSKDKDLWVAAMNEELKSYTDIKVWELVNKPDGKNILKCKWVYKIKRNCNGEVVKFKARLVAVGCAQKYGIDFQDTFAPVVRYSTLRLFFALSVKIGLQIHHVDISTAFLNGDLKEDIYMSQPDGIESIPGKVYKLKKAVYGLKQASKCWYDKVHIVMTEMGFNQSEYEPCVYLWKDGFKLVIVALYVDDFFIFFNDFSQCDKLKSVLSVNFSTKDLGPVSECLSMKVTKSEYSIKLDQRAYCEKLLTKFGMLNSVPAKTPIEYGLKLEKSDKCDKSIPYQEAIGGLLYLSLCTRPDIAYSVNYLSRFCNGYSKEHWKAVQRIFRYLRGTMDYGVKYSESEEDVIGYCDASFGNDCTERKSVSGYAVTLSNGAISWESRKQEVTALSSTEAEYICITHASKECMFLQGFLFELCGRYGSILLYNDNMSALKLSEHPGYHSRTKHIDVRFHYIRELCNDGKLELMHMSTKDMPADVLTKGLNHECHVKCIASLGVS